MLGDSKIHNNIILNSSLKYFIIELYLFLELKNILSPIKVEN